MNDEKLFESITQLLKRTFNTEVLEKFYETHESIKAVQHFIRKNNAKLAETHGALVDIYQLASVIHNDQQTGLLSQLLSATIIAEDKLECFISELESIRHNLKSISEAFSDNHHSQLAYEEKVLERRAKPRAT